MSKPRAGEAEFALFAEMNAAALQAVMETAAAVGGPVPALTAARRLRGLALQMLDAIDELESAIAAGDQAIAPHVAPIDLSEA